LMTISRMSCTSNSIKTSIRTRTTSHQSENLCRCSLSFNFFEDLQRYSQLDRMTISSYEDSLINSHFPRVTIL
ncbi:unnamed protein product, partial [Rotaria magnacalcarata]